MKCLLDTNILLRSMERHVPKSNQAADAVRLLQSSGFDMCLAPQNLYEFWVVSTRPLQQNGRGQSVDETIVEIDEITSVFTIVEETVDVRLKWRALIETHQVRGKNAHDAHLVASMLVNGITHILTFNAPDFTRYPDMTVLSPQTVLAQQQTP